MPRPTDALERLEAALGVRGGSPRERLARLGPSLERLAATAKLPRCGWRKFCPTFRLGIGGRVVCVVACDQSGPVPTDPPLSDGENFVGDRDAVTAEPFTECALRESCAWGGREDAESICALCRGRGPLPVPTPVDSPAATTTRHSRAGSFLDRDDDSEDGASSAGPIRKGV